MNKLKTAKLYFNGLITVSGKLVENYNKCLTLLGFTSTACSSFSIDAMGWSPEIAKEKQNNYYLNNGDANPTAIIISPEQKNKPVYMPFHSFDRAVMEHIFRVYGEKIKDITRNSAICIDFDQEIDAFYEPLDVLKYNNISIDFRLINNFDKAQKEQLKLVETFFKDNNFINEDLHQQLLASANTYGDLRHRKLTLHPINYNISTFYTKAFGGIYVFRELNVDLVVFEDAKWHKEAIKNTTLEVLIYHISQPELFEKLRAYKIIDYDLEAIVKTKRYKRIKKYELSRYLNRPQHPIKDILNNDILFKSYLNKLDIEDRKKVMSVERYLEKIEVSNVYKVKDIVDQSLLNAMYEPHTELSSKNKDIVWRLLVNSAPKDILYLYWYDKELFYAIYNSWDNSLKDWAIEVIGDGSGSD